MLVHINKEIGHFAWAVTNSVVIMFPLIQYIPDARTKTAKNRQLFFSGGYTSVRNPPDMTILQRPHYVPLYDKTRLHDFGCEKKGRDECSHPVLVTHLTQFRRRATHLPDF